MDTALVLGIVGSSLSAVAITGLVAAARFMGQTNARLGFLERWFWAQIAQTQVQAGKMAHDSEYRLSAEIAEKFQTQCGSAQIERCREIVRGLSDPMPDEGVLARILINELGDAAIETRAKLLGVTSAEYVTLGIACLHDFRSGNYDGPAT